MIKFYAQNLVKHSVITTSSENLLFPASNIKHPFRSKVFRSLTGSDSIVFDLGETSEIDSVLIVPDKVNGFGASSFTLELNGTSNFDAPAFSVALDINQTHELALAEFSIQEYRFARLVMTSTLGYCELSKIFIGKKTDFNNEVSIDYGWSYRETSLSSEKKNAYGQRFIDSRPRQKRLSFALRALNKDELDEVFNIIDTNGDENSFFVRIGTGEIINNPDRFAGNFFLSDYPSITNRSFGLYDLSMSLEEAM